MCPAGTVLSSWDLTVLSVSVLDWSDSELLTFAFPLLPGDTLRLKEEKKPSNKNQPFQINKKKKVS